MTTTFRRKLFASLLLTAWSVLLTALTGILGGVPLRGLRMAMGPTGFWALTLVATALLAIANWWMLALLYLSLVMVIGLFSELEEHGFTLVAGGAWSVVITSLMLGGGFAFWVSHQGSAWPSALIGKVESYLSGIPGWTDKVGIEAKDLVLQVPSLVVVVLTLGLFMALLFQRRMAVLNGGHRGPVHRLNRFAVPDAFIWVFILSVAGAFLAKGGWLQPLAINALNITAVVLFLQGLAVVASYFEYFKVGWFWQMLLLLVLVTQLFILVSLVGLVDYWMDFRSRLAKRAEEPNRERKI